MYSVLRATFVLIRDDLLLVHCTLLDLVFYAITSLSPWTGELVPEFQCCNVLETLRCCLYVYPKTSPRLYQKLSDCFTNLPFDVERITFGSLISYVDVLFQTYDNGQECACPFELLLPLSS